MFESKYNKLLTIVLVIVIIAIIGLLVFWGIDVFQKSSITNETAEFVDNYQGDDQTPDDETENNENDGSNPLDEIEESNTTGSSKRTKKTYKGYVVNGTMEIPKISFKYPVLEEFNKKSLETSVVILYGAGLNQPGNTVIIGHNYRNGVFFSNNKKLNNGDKIYVTDYTGKKVSYTIYNKFETTPEDTSFYQRDTNGNPEITLSTCTDDSSARLIIFAKADQ
ncbi:MAG: sortase [Clostridia bacterium]|jgi:LPXTG-site transpeptidase (sortase) family protein